MHPLVDGEHALAELLGLGVARLRRVDAGERVQRQSGIGMLGAERGLCNLDLVLGDELGLLGAAEAHVEAREVVQQPAQSGMLGIDLPGDLDGLLCRLDRLGEFSIDGKLDRART